jgi:phage shock protein PspC (stress-responsive transcriptional regulator)
MNRVTIINLNGNAYQLEESGYEALRSYLDNAARRLEGNPDRDEIIADIEQAIADKFQAMLGASKNVVMIKEVEKVLEEMGPVQDGGEPREGAKNAQSSERSSSARGFSSSENKPDGDASGPAVKRLYRIREGAMLAGVCNGLAAYFNIDVTFVRLAFVALTIFWGTGTLIYLVMAIVVPTANTPAEKAAASGAAATTQEFIRRAREGYYEGMKTFHDKEARREWKRKFKQQMRGWQQSSQYYWNQNQYHWKNAANPSFGPMPAPGPILPFLWLIRSLITLAGLFALYSLVTKGAAFGIALPAGVPLWVGIVLVIVVWKFVAWPFNAMCWYSGHPGWQRGACMGPFGAFFDFVAGLAVLGLVIWFADRYIPQFHEAMKHLTPLLQQLVDSIQHWLEKH